MATRRQVKSHWTPNSSPPPSPLFCYYPASTWGEFLFPSAVCLCPALSLFHSLVVQLQNWWCQREKVMLNHQGRSIFLRLPTMEPGALHTFSSTPHISLMWYCYPNFSDEKIVSERLRKLPSDWSNQPPQFAWDWGRSWECGTSVLKLGQFGAKLITY